jgi:YD repeat-containing protein
MEVENALGHENEFEFDETLGKVTKALAPNGYLRCWAYDEFGRLESRSDSSTAVTGGIGQGSCDPTPLATFAFEDLGLPGDQRIEETRVAGAELDDVHGFRFFDGLGRQYQTETESAQNEFEVVVRSWGSRGEATCASLPVRRVGGVPTSADREDTYPHRRTEYDPALRPESVALVWSSGTGNSAEEVSSEYEIDGFNMGTNVLVEKRTIRGGTDGSSAPATPDREQYIARDNRDQVVSIRDGSSVADAVLLDRDPMGRVTLMDGPDVSLLGGATDENLVAIVYDAAGHRVELSQPQTVTQPDPPVWTYEYDLNGDLRTQFSPRGWASDSIGMPSGA